MAGNLASAPWYRTVRNPIGSVKDARVATAPGAIEHHVAARLADRRRLPLTSIVMSAVAQPGTRTRSFIRVGSGTVSRRETSFW